MVLLVAFHHSLGTPEELNEDTTLLQTSVGNRLVIQGYMYLLNYLFYTSKLFKVHKYCQSSNTPFKRRGLSEISSKADKRSVGCIGCTFYGAEKRKSEGEVYPAIKRFMFAVVPLAKRLRPNIDIPCSTSIALHLA